jgi:hypothetical protein
MAGNPIQTHLRDLPPGTFASKYIFEAIPFVFDGNMDSYIAWKSALGERIEVDPRAISFTGSAGVGISLNPAKSLKAFNADSDVDIAVVSFHHFDVAWRSLRSLSSASRLALSKRQRESHKSHERNYIYWGTIATDRLLEILPFAKPWVTALSYMAGLDPTQGREINARIYRDFESLRAYQLRSVEIARNQLEQTGDLQ